MSLISILRYNKTVSHVDSLWQCAVPDAEHGLCKKLQWGTELWNNSHHLIFHHSFLTLCVCVRVCVCVCVCSVCVYKVSFNKKTGLPPPPNKQKKNLEIRLCD